MRVAKVPADDFDAEIAGKDLVLMRFLDVMLYSRLGGGDVRVETPRMTDNPERLSAWVTKGEAEYRAEIARLKAALHQSELAGGTLQTALRQLVEQWRSQLAPLGGTSWEVGRAFTLEACAEQLESLLPALEPTP